ncbi:hypothetical protein METSMIALI_00011 [Methanobrevibacter smithii DSM 2375]|uniref:Uncharacterized protein n=1 Tax=Methanobrevibacter smithii DSM 2375 TaxID=483214 RepID=B9ACE0_METSM|nr:hypothetical protein METSMIALI_00011 [Methanobrevibacter smithii DSM 2375]
MNSQQQKIPILMEMILELPNTTIIVDDKTGTFQIPTKSV